MTKAQIVFEKFSSHHFPEKVFTPPFALAEACAFRDRIESAMKAAGLSADDTATAIVFIDPNMTQLQNVRLIPGKEEPVLRQMMALPGVSIGIVIAILDREQNERLLGAVPFMKGEQSLEWLSEVLDRQEVKQYVN